MLSRLTQNHSFIAFNYVIELISKRNISNNYSEFIKKNHHQTLAQVDHVLEDLNLASCLINNYDCNIYK